MFEIRYANELDFYDILLLDKHIKKEKLLLEKINKKEYILCISDNKLVGLLRYSLFWDEIPFINFLYFHVDYRRNGFGTKLVDFLKIELKKQGYNKIMTSTLKKENGKFFYQKIGFELIGSFNFEKDEIELIYELKI